MPLGGKAKKQKNQSEQGDPQEVEAGAANEGAKRTTKRLGGTKSVPAASSAAAASRREAQRLAAQGKLKAQLMAGEKNAVEQAEDDPFEYRSMYINELTPNPRNSRTRHINPLDPLTNALPEDHPDFKENSSVIEDIRTMSEHLKDVPLQTPIEIYRDGTRHMVNAGHVRYFSSLVAYGAHGKIETKCYHSEPRSTAARRFRENNARHDLALKPKAMDFKMARDAVISECGDLSAVDMATNLGISRTSVRIYSIAVDDKNVWRALDGGGITKLRTLQLIYNKGPLKNADRMADMADFLLADPKNEGILEAWLTEDSAAQKKPTTKGRKRKKAKIESGSLRALRHLVEGDFVKEFEWNDSDFESLEAFQEKLDACMKAFAAQHKKE